MISITKFFGIFIFSIVMYSFFTISSNASTNTSQTEQKEDPKYIVKCYSSDNKSLIYTAKVISYSYVDGKLLVMKENNNAPVFILGNCNV